MAEVTMVSGKTYVMEERIPGEFITKFMKWMIDEEAPLFKATDGTFIMAAHIESIMV